MSEITAILTVPVDDELCVWVLDDVDDDTGRPYERVLETGAYEARLVEDDTDGFTEWWELPRQAVAVRCADVPDEWVTLNNKSMED